MKNRLLRIGVLSMFGLIIAVGIAWIEVNGKGSDMNRLRPVAGDQFGGAYSLTDQNGNTITNESFPGQYKLIYFGFTYCPAICPTELSKISTALEKLGPKAENIQPIFITVDPERDTVETMGNYVKMFHPKIVGLTGTPEEINVALKGYKVYASKVNDPELTEYTMDHSSYIYFLDPEDRLLALYKIDSTAAEMVENIKQWMDQSDS